MQGKYVVAGIRDVRNVRNQHLHETVSGPKDNVNVTVTFDRSSGSIGDSQFQVAFSIIDHTVC